MGDGSCHFPCPVALGWRRSGAWRRRSHLARLDCIAVGAQDDGTAFHRRGRLACDHWRNPHRRSTFDLPWDQEENSERLPLIRPCNEHHRGPEEAPFPSNVGLLFFNPKPHRFFPATQIEVVWFPEGAGGDRFEEQTFQGPLSRMVRDCTCIRRNYWSETVVKHPDRAEAARVGDFPHAAVEDAVVNAIHHRSYEEREPGEVRISPEDSRS